MINISNTQTAAGEGYGGRAIGRLEGRRVLSTGDSLVLPNTSAGKALHQLLAGTGGVSPVRLSTLTDRSSDLIELRDLIDACIALSTPERCSVKTALKACGIKEPQLSKLAADEWVTEERVRDLWYAIKHAFGYQWAENPQGVLIGMLSRHEEATQESGEWYYCHKCQVYNSDDCTCDVPQWSPNNAD